MQREQALLNYSDLFDNDYETDNAAESYSRLCSPSALGGIATVPVIIGVGGRSP